MEQVLHWNHFQAKEGQEHDWEQPAQVSQECILPDLLCRRDWLSGWKESIGQADPGFSKFCDTISPSNEKNLGGMDWMGGL